MAAMRMPKSLSEQEALARLQALCAQGEHSSGEMRDKMRRWLLPHDAQERVLEQLIDDRFVDDERFSRIFVRDKLRFDRWGRRRLEQALYKKGVARDVICSTLDAVPEADYIAVLRPLLDSKRRSLKAATDYELNAKLVRFALGRGFSFAQIRQCMDGADEVEGIGDDTETAYDDAEEFL